ncbi:hypothetical protein BH20ACT19_BH20ACT19_06400 [soil metagenome]
MRGFGMQGATGAVLVAAGVVALAGPGVAGATVPAGNLVQNPGAEAAEGASDSATVRTPPGWGATPSFTAVKYGSPDFPSTALSASIGGGSNFFAGGPNAATSIGEQTFDVSVAAPEIDSGRVSVRLAAHLGGFSTDGDNAKITAELQDANGDTTFSTVQIGPVTAADRSNQTTLLARSAIADVPAGTRDIRLTFTATRAAGAYNDGYADNVSLTLDMDDDPVAVNDSATVGRNSAATVLDVLANDTDSDGGPKQVASVTQPANGTATVTGGGSGVDYKPNPDYCNNQAGGSPDTFNYSLNGGSTATVRVSVTCLAPDAFQLIAQPAGCAQRGRLFTGTNGNNTITGTALSDVLLGLGGNDALRGLAADDCLYGGAGNDTLFGGAGRDRADGGAGNDRLNGDSGNDRISGGTGSDRISGGTSNDSVSGGSGRDRISGGSGGDRIDGGSGNDRISARDRARDRISCGSGRDVVTADRTDRVARNCERVRRR